MKRIFLLVLSLFVLSASSSKRRPKTEKQTKDKKNEKFKVQVSRVKEFVNKPEELATFLFLKHEDVKVHKLLKAFSNRKIEMMECFLEAAEEPDVLVRSLLFARAGAGLAVERDARDDVDVIRYIVNKGDLNLIIQALKGISHRPENTLFNSILLYRCVELISASGFPDDRVDKYMRTVFRDIIGTREKADNEVDGYLFGKFQVPGYSYILQAISPSFGKLVCNDEQAKDMSSWVHNLLDCKFDQPNGAGSDVAVSNLRYAILRGDWKYDKNNRIPLSEKQQKENCILFNVFPWLSTQLVCKQLTNEPCDPDTFYLFALLKYHSPLAAHAFNFDAKKPPCDMIKMFVLDLEMSPKLDRHHVFSAFCNMIRSYPGVSLYDSFFNLPEQILEYEPNALPIICKLLLERYFLRLMCCTILSANMTLLLRNHIEELRLDQGKVELVTKKLIEKYESRYGIECPRLPSGVISKALEIVTNNVIVTVESATAESGSNLIAAAGAASSMLIGAVGEGEDEQLPARLPGGIVIDTDEE